MADDEILAFVQRSIPTVWALDLLLALMRDESKSHDAADLVREMRASTAAVTAAAAALKRTGLVEGDGSYRFAPTTPALRECARALEAFYEWRPAAVVTAILSAPNPNLRTFADSFKLKE